MLIEAIAFRMVQRNRRFCNYLSEGPESERPQNPSENRGPSTDKTISYDGTLLHSLDNMSETEISVPMDAISDPFHSSERHRDVLRMILGLTIFIASSKRVEKNLAAFFIPPNAAWRTVFHMFWPMPSELPLVLELVGQILRFPCAILPAERGMQL